MIWMKTLCVLYCVFPSFSLGRQFPRPPPHSRKEEPQATKERIKSKIGSNFTENVNNRTRSGRRHVFSLTEKGPNTAQNIRRSLEAFRLRSRVCCESLTEGWPPLRTALVQRWRRHQHVTGMEALGRTRNFGSALLWYKNGTQAFKHNHAKNTTLWIRHAFPLCQDGLITYFYN